MSNIIDIMIQPWYECDRKWTHHSSFENPTNLVKAQLILLKSATSSSQRLSLATNCITLRSWEGLINPFFLDCHRLHHHHFTSLFINDLIWVHIPNRLFHLKNSTIQHTKDKSRYIEICPLYVTILVILQVKQSTNQSVKLMIN